MAIKSESDNAEGGWNRQPCPNIKQARKILHLYLLVIQSIFSLSFNSIIAQKCALVISPTMSEGPQLLPSPVSPKEENPNEKATRLPLTDLKCAPGDIARNFWDSTR